MKKGKKPKQQQQYDDKNLDIIAPPSLQIMRANYIRRPEFTHVSKNSIPQFDFEGLPVIPENKPYGLRLKYIKKNATVGNNNGHSVPQTERLPVLRNIRSTGFESSMGISSVNTMKLPKMLDREKLLDCGHSSDPDDVLEVLAPERDLDCVDITCLREFTRLYYLDLSGNNIQMEHLSLLPVLRELNLQCNNLSHITTPPDGFTCLEVCTIVVNA
jgi:Leucine-rich repeat (LRR) protein